MSDQFSVEADRDVCVGAGNCVRLAPEVFDQDEVEGLVVVLDPEPPPGEHAAVLDARHNCPSGAISIFEPVTPRSAPGR